MNIGSKSATSLQRGPADPKFQVDGVAPTSHSSFEKTRVNYPTCGIKIWTDLSSVLSQSTRSTDGRTDGRTNFSSLVSVYIPCTTVKSGQILTSRKTYGTDLSDVWVSFHF